MPSFTLDGKDLPLRDGETVAAALSRAGELTCRTTGSGAPRGLFCGMGVCHDCLVEIDGRPNRRACMSYVRPGLVVRREVERRSLSPRLSARPPAMLDDIPTVTPDVLVVGAGPAGLSAALAAARHGAEVLLVDERAFPGGQFYKQLCVASSQAADAQQRRGARLIRQVLKAGAQMREKTVVWAAFEPLDFFALGPDGILLIRPRKAILATGASEVAWPVPGWTLPGVMTTGAAQTLWRSSRAVPGRRVLIAGNGPLNLQLACELTEAGCEVVGLAEASGGPEARGAHWIARMATAVPGLVLKGIGYEFRRRIAGIPFLRRTRVIGISEGDDGLRAVLKSPTGERSLVADVVCLGYGFQSSNELARALGCEFAWSEGRLLPVTDATGRSSLENLWIVGDGARPEGAHAAEATGKIAGIAAASGPDAALSPEMTRARRKVARHKRFQHALWKLYGAENLDPPATPDTIICRCEEKRLADAEAAIAAGLTTMGDIKRATRIGMGRCQGRYCGPVLQTLLARRCGIVPDELSGFAPRVPVRPIALGDLARIGTE